jgi:tRNA G18 (ribose-2'-O)-methylase SpoU
VLSQADKLLQIPMSGRKESFNVAVAAGIALYHLRYFKR